jgi:hypothetical protein
MGKGKEFALGLLSLHGAMPISKKGGPDEMK